jgi:hypothetical protein
MAGSQLPRSSNFAYNFVRPLNEQCPMAAFAYKASNRPVRVRLNLLSMRIAPAMSYPGFHELPDSADRHYR